MSIVLLILGLVLFVGLVVVHEFGHFLVARRNHIVVEEFGIGFPPRAYGKKTKGGWLFSLNWLPIGGFVRLKGEHDADRSPGSFGAASVSAKVKVMLAGVGMNLLVGLVLFTLLALIGMPKIISKQNMVINEEQFTVARDTKVTKQALEVIYVEPGSPARQAGLQNYDQLVTIGSEKGIAMPVSLGSFPDQTKKLAGQVVSLSYRRGGQLHTTSLQLRGQQEVESSLKTDKPKGYLGIVPYEVVVQRSTWSAPIVAVGLSAQLTRLTLKGIGRALQGLGRTIGGLVTGNRAARTAGQTQATSQVSGPVGIFFVLRDSAKQGIAVVLFIIAIISLTLAIMNALPVPALDGGRLFVLLLFRGLRRPLSKQAEDWIHGTGFAVLMLLVVLITFVDVQRFF